MDMDMDMDGTLLLQSLLDHSRRPGKQADRPAGDLTSLEPVRADDTSRSRPSDMDDAPTECCPHIDRCGSGSDQLRFS